MLLQGAPVGPGDLLQEAMQYLPDTPLVVGGLVGVGAVAAGGRMSGRLLVRKWARRAAKQDGYALPMFVRDQRNVGRTERVGNTMSVPRTGSILALGASRSGKTETGKHIVDQMQADENEPMVVYDHKNDYQQFFNEIDREYIRLSSSGSTHTWNIFEEIEDKNDAREIARSIFADVEDASGSSGAYFGPAARQVFTIVLRYLKEQAEGADDTPTNASLVAFFMKHDATEAYDILSDVDGFSGIASHLNPESDDQQGGVWSNLQLAMEDYFTGDFERGLGNNDNDGDEDEGEEQNTEQTAPDAEKQQDEAEDDEDDEDGDQYASGFSIREYMENPNGKALVLDRPAREGGTTAPVFRLLIDLAAREALADEERGAYLVLDEIAKVPAINRLDELVNVGAGLNTQVFVTLQSVAQLRANYGEEGASAILSGFLTTVLLRCDDPKSVEFVQSKLGKEKEDYTAHVEKAQLPRNRQKTMHRERKPEHEHVFSEAEINSWRPGEGVLVRPQSWAYGRVKLYDD